MNDMNLMAIQGPNVLSLMGPDAPEQFHVANSPHWPYLFNPDSWALIVILCICVPNRHLQRNGHPFLPRETSFDL